MRRHLLSLVAALLCGSAMAQADDGRVHAAAAGETSAARKYAVMSLIGDAFWLVQYRGETPLANSSNRHALSTADPILDKIALRAANDVLRRLNPQPQVSLLMGTPELYAQQGKWLADGRFTPPAELSAALKTEQATHMILISKLRSAASIKTANGSVGSGMLEGLGYYLDQELPTARSDTGSRGQGFLAPFTYFRVVLIDLGRGTLDKEVLVKESFMISEARNDNGQGPWDALTPAQKINTLANMIVTGVTQAVSSMQ